jgi:carbon monoxide dehydrogenase subunit G
MITIQLQKDIEASPEVVFDLFADHTQFPTWDPHFIDASLTKEGPIVKGSKGITVGKLMGRRVENEIYYDAYDRPTFVSGGTSSGAVIAYYSVDFIPTETGTQIDFQLEIELKGIMRLFEGIIKSTTVKQKEESLDALEAYIANNY